MNTQDKRFLAAALGDGEPAPIPLASTTISDPTLGDPALGGFVFQSALEWPFAPHAGIKSFALHCRTSTRDRWVLTACWGGAVTGTELSVGLDLDLEPQDTNDVFGKSDHLIGQLVAPETAPATRNTVQIDFAERLTPGTESFGLAKIRGRILWQSGNRHILRIHRQMPKGWPEPPHDETDESAFTGRTAPFHPPASGHRGSRILLGVPILTPDRRKIVDVTIGSLTTTLAWLRENAAG